MDWPIRNHYCVGQSDFHGWVIRPSAMTPFVQYNNGRSDDVVSHSRRLRVKWVHGGFLLEQEGTEVPERTLLRFLCYLLLKNAVFNPPRMIDPESCNFKTCASGWWRMCVPASPCHHPDRNSKKPVGKTGSVATILRDDMNSPPSPLPHDLPANGATIDWAAALASNGGWMRTVVRSRVRDSHATDEVMQEIALAVWQQNSRPTDASKVAPWLYRVAIRQTINHRRRSGRLQRLLAGFARNGAHKETSAANPRDWVLAEEVQQSVAVALEKLSPHDREILLLKYTEGWTYKQLAEQLGVKVKTVEHRLMKARRALRNCLRERGLGVN